MPKTALGGPLARFLLPLAAVPPQAGKCSYTYAKPRNDLSSCTLFGSGALTMALTFAGVACRPSASMT